MDDNTQNNNTDGSVAVVEEPKTLEGADIDVAIDKLSPPPEEKVVEEKNTNSIEVNTVDVHPVVAEEPVTDVDSSTEVNNKSEPKDKDNDSTEAHNQTPVASLNPDPLTDSNSDDRSSMISHNSVATPAHEHRNNKKLAVIVVVVVAVLLAGAAVYVYLSAQDNTVQDSTINQTTNRQAERTTGANVPATAATLGDVDTVTQDINTALNALDDTIDFSESAISDQALGL